MLATLHPTVGRSSGRYGAALARHDELLFHAVDEIDGEVFKHTGDGIAAVFASVSKAVQVAARAQRIQATRLSIRPARVAEAVATARNTIGDQHNERLRSQGAALSPIELEEYVLALADQET